MLLSPQETLRNFLPEKSMNKREKFRIVWHANNPHQISKDNNGK